MKYLISFLPNGKIDNKYVANILDEYCSGYYSEVAGLILFESAVGMKEIRDGLDAKNVDCFMIIVARKPTTLVVGGIATAFYFVKHYYLLLIYNFF